MPLVLKMLMAFLFRLTIPFSTPITNAVFNFLFIGMIEIQDFILYLNLYNLQKNYN